MTNNLTDEELNTIRDRVRLLNFADPASPTISMCATLLDEVERLQREREGSIGLIARERRRQIEEEGWTPEHDDEHVEDELAQAAACYALGDSRISNITAEYFIDIWPSEWDREWDTIKKKSRLRQLVIAGALIAAEIDRLQRRAATTQSDS